MEVALRRRLEGVASISISQQHQTTEVVFAPGPHVFSPVEFRAAVGEADVEVLSFEIELCGRVGEESGMRWFVAGSNRFALNDEAGWRSAGGTCVLATLDDQHEPYALIEVLPKG